MDADIPKSRDGFRESPIGHWVGCLWNFAAGNGFPHPQDAELIETLCPYGITTPCIAVDGEFFVLQYTNTTFRVHPFTIRIMPFPPRFSHDEPVRTILGPDVKTALVSPVRRITWHVKLGAYAYYLDGNRRRRKRMYLEHQLEKAA